MMFHNSVKHRWYLQMYFFFAKFPNVTQFDYVWGKVTYPYHALVVESYFPQIESKRVTSGNFGENCRSYANLHLVSSNFPMWLNFDFIVESNPTPCHVLIVKGYFPKYSQKESHWEILAKTADPMRICTWIRQFPQCNFFWLYWGSKPYSISSTYS